MPCFFAYKGVDIRLCGVQTPKPTLDRHLGSHFEVFLQYVSGRYCHASNLCMSAADYSAMEHEWLQLAATRKTSDMAT